ncbi:hypothetical protein TNCT_724351 [Trichonephila clavata]|uniref:Uncharacterized protein n=1 Tax=Trichonephila clavata TaxID=2740835 RepID=A0A8X6LN91_TRICU|nr:hypothetical protein TNCT_724351 [Trichonephila clavata]
MINHQQMQFSVKGLSCSPLPFIPSPRQSTLSASLNTNLPWGYFRECGQPLILHDSLPQLKVLFPSLGFIFCCMGKKKIITFVLNIGLHEKNECRSFEIHETRRSEGLHGPRRAQRDFRHRVAQTQAEQGFHGAQLPVLQKYVQEIFGRSAELHRISHQFWHQMQFRNRHCGHGLQQDQYGESFNI